MTKETISNKSIEIFLNRLKSDESGATFRKALRNVFSEFSNTEEETSRKYDKYAQELEDYGAPAEIVKFFRHMAKDEINHHFVFNRLFYGLK